MADSQRIEELRRRVLKDPASIAFAQLAEECRRAGQVQEAVDVCRAGLAIHPGYLSARVTLGRALIELNELDEALHELSTVLKGAPENLAAIRGIAEIHHRRGDLPDALAQYRTALSLARNDPELQQTVTELARQVDRPVRPVVENGLSFEQISDEFLKMAPPPPPEEPETAAQAPDPPVIMADGHTASTAVIADERVPTPPAVTDVPLTPLEADADAHTPPVDAVGNSKAPSSDAVADADAPPLAAAADSLVPSLVGIADAHATRPAEAPAEVDAAPADVDKALLFAFAGEALSPGLPQTTDLDAVAREQATRTIAALDQWLDAIHVARADRRA
jgi:tetratricopeptide (TPR) repeat protein